MKLKLLNFLPNFVDFILSTGLDSKRKKQETFRDNHRQKKSQDTLKTEFLADKKIPPRGVEPLSGNSKTPVNKQLTKNTNPVLATSLDKTLQKYPDLAEVVEVWPVLPEDTKKAIKALVQTHSKGTR